MDKAGLDQAILRFFRDDIGGILITDEDGNVLYEDGQTSFIRTEKTNWKAACPPPVPGQKKQTWDLVRSGSGKTYMVLTSSFTDEEGLRQIHHLVDTSLYMDLFRDVTAYSRALQAEKEHDWMTGLYNKGKFMELKRSLFQNQDSLAVFNMDAYVSLWKKFLGIRPKRNIVRKEVIINDPDYADMDKTLQQLITTSREYLSTLPRSTFFGYMKYIVRYWFSRREDMQAEGIMQITEYVVEVLSNSKDRYVLRLLNGYPVMETRNFRFYRRRRKDVRAVIKYSEQIRTEIGKYIN